MDRAALYLRLSKEDIDKMNKGDDSESIINQRLLLTDYAIEHGFQVVDVYSDDDYSGLYDDRPEFDRLIKDSKLGKFNVVIAKTQSRFTRNMEHMEKYLHHIFPMLGIRFIGVVDGVDTQNMANKKSRQINGLVNEWYCEDLSNNIKAVFKQKMKAGQFLAAFAPYGYLKDPKDNHKLIIDEAAADVVRKIYALFLQGYSTKKIAAILEDEKILNPTAYKKSQGLKYTNVKADAFSAAYGFWSETTIKRILTNETYIGSLLQGTCTKLSYKDKKVVAVPKKDWIVIKNHHEPIIDEKVFYKVAQMRSKRRICSERGEVHIFAGKLRCASCSHTMIKSGGVRGRTDDWFLRCQLANKSRLRECTSHSIRFSIVEETVTKKLMEIVGVILDNSEYVTELEKVISNEEDIKDSLKKEQKIIKELDSKIAEITQSVKMLYTDRIKNNISENMFFQLKNDFESEAEGLEKKRAEIQKKIEHIKEKTEFEKNLKGAVGKYADFSKLTYEIVNDFIDYIEIGEKNKETKEQEIIIHWNF